MIPFRTVNVNRYKKKPASLLYELVGFKMCNNYIEIKLYSYFIYTKTFSFYSRFIL